MKTMGWIGPILLCVISLYTSLMTPSTTQADTDPSFIHAFSDGVWFLQWTESKGTLSGQLQSVFVQPDLTMHNNNQTLTGVHNGTDVTITLGGIFGSTAYTGSLRGSTLTLNIPMRNGTMQAVVFQSGTVADYNRAVAAFQAYVDAMIRDRQRAADLAARQRAVVNANERVRVSLYDVQVVTRRLNQNTDFQTVLDSFAKHWAKMQRDYEHLQADAARQPLTCTQLYGPVSSDLNGTLASDLYGPLASDNYGAFASRRLLVVNDISQLTKAERDTRQAFNDLQSAVARNPLGTPAPAYKQSQVESVLAVADQQVRDSAAALKAAEDQKNHILDDANALFKRAKEFVASLTCTPP